MKESITVEATGPVRTIRLGRAPINALDGGGLEELAAAADLVAADNGCRVVILASAIEGIFCAGGDLRFWRTYTRDRALEVTLAGREAFTRVARMRQPTIAAIDGHVIGDGIALALSCDLRLASPRATFRLPEASYGFIPGWGTLHRLAWAIGFPRTLDMFLSGRSVDARTALEWGLVSRLHPAEQFAQGLEALVEGLLAMSPTALSLGKTALLYGVRGLDETPEGETAAFREAWGGEDWQEGIAALLAKRSPDFGRGWTSLTGRERR